MTKRKKTSPEKPDTETEATGGVEMDFGGIFRGLGNFVDLIGKLAEVSEKHIERQGEFKLKGLGDQAHGVYGFSIRSGIGGGKPKVEPFGNVHTGKEGLEVGDIREPLVDVFDEAREVVVTAELPGVVESDISVTFEGEVVKIETLGARRYVKTLDLPAAVKPGTLKQSYNNGVLELRVAKSK